MFDPTDGPAPPARRGTLDPAFCLLAGAAMVAVLFGLWVWWVLEAPHRPDTPLPRPRPAVVSVG